MQIHARRKEAHPEAVNPICLLVDIGDTLVAASRIASYSLSRAESSLTSQGLLTPAIDFVGAFQAANSRNEGPDINHLFSSERIVRGACSIAGLEPSGEFVTAFLAIYQGSVREQLQPDPGLRSLLESLKTAGHHIGVVTDGTTREQTETLRRISILDLIDSVVTSEQLGVEKPNAIMFTTALEQLGNSDPSKAIMVGDSLPRDIAGAKSLGMKTVLITKYVQPAMSEIAKYEPDYVIKSMNKIAQLL